MRFFDYLRLAFKNIRRQRVRSGLTIAAVVIGAVFVTVMITLVLSIETAVESHMEAMGELTEVIVRPSSELAEQSGFGFGGTPPGTEEGYKKIDNNVVTGLRAISHVEGARPQSFINQYSTLSMEGTDKKYQANLLAYEPVPALDKPLIAGRQLEPGEVGKIIIGGDTLKKLGYKDDPEGIIGKKVILGSQEMQNGVSVDVREVETGMAPPVQAPEAAQSKTHPDVAAEIVGVISGIEEARNYTTMTWGRELETFTDFVAGRLKSKCMIDERGYDSVLLKVDGTDNVEKVAASVEKMGLGARTARDFLDDLKKGLSILGLGLGAMGLISLFIAALGVINTMVMAIYDRTREIGVMRACGARKKTVRRLFTFEATFLGFLGGVIGVIIAYLLTFPGNLIVNKILEGQNVATGNVVSLPFWLILGVVGFTTLVGFLAGIYPASRAARLDPVEALRYE